MNIRRNTYGSTVIDLFMGRFRWYRKWRRGYWWFSPMIDQWWRHKDIIESPPEDYGE